MKKQKAFTLIEVMVVMAIIAVLAVLIIGAITVARHTAEDTTHRSNAKTLHTAIEAYFTKYKVYCGGEAAVTCHPGTSISFNALADNLQTAGVLTKDLNSTSCDAVSYNILIQSAFAKKHPHPSQNDGGGRITNLTSDGLTINPVNHDCSAILSSDIITIP